MPDASDTSVVIACHTEERWDQILATVGSAARHGPRAVVVAVDHNPRLAARLRELERPDLVVTENTGPHRGASATRNAGVAAITTAIVAFLDDDETADDGWLAALVAPFAAEEVVGTGGRCLPAWRAGRPAWFPDEFGWVVGASFAGMPAGTSRVRNVWAGNMAVRTDAFRRVGGFRTDFGKVGGSSRPEDTDLCIRVASAVPDGHWLYVPDAVIRHDVPPERGTFRFFLGRAYAEGRGKVEMQRDLHQKGALGDESVYLRRTLPQGIGRHVREHRAAPAAAIVAGMAAAAAGAAAAVLARTLPTGRGAAGRRS